MLLHFLTRKIIITLVIVIVVSSCENKDKSLAIDVSNVDLSLQTYRFEKDLFRDNNIEYLKDKYGEFLLAFTEQIIRIGNYNQPAFDYQLTKFTKDAHILKVRSDVDRLYKDFSPYSSKLEQAFKRYKYYFPDKNTPKIITYISGFNYAIVTDTNYLGIGLDMFLGKDYPAYAQLGIPNYKTNSMDHQHLVAGALLGWISTEFESQENQVDLLSEMIHQGKLLYLLNALLPDEKNEVMVNYSVDQINWCRQNKKQIWFYFIDNNLLYSKENNEIIKYMGEAPFIQGFPEGSPGRIGHWQGWKIVKAYMKKNATSSLKQLMNEKDAQKILNESKYKP